MTDKNAPDKKSPGDLQVRTLRPGARIIIVLFIWAVFLGAYPALLRLYGYPVNTLLSIPIFITGWLFGLWGGLLAGVLSAVLLVAWSFVVFGISGWRYIFAQLPGILTGLVAGVSSGWISDLLTRLNRQSSELVEEHQAMQEQIAERQQVEEALQQAKSELEKRVQERAQDLIQANQELKREIIERRRAEEELRALLQEKDVLLKEVHHRVKNNLQVISSLLGLQAAKIKDPQVLEIFREGQNRVRLMALIHEKLYQSGNLAQVDFSEYVRTLAYYLFSSYRVDVDRVQLSLRLDPVFLGIDAAVTCGLILNELVSNALKHAFPSGREGEIRIELRYAPDGRVLLVVSDDGVGLPQDLNLADPPSLGLQLVNSLVSQLDGEIALKREGGTRFAIAFMA